MKYNEALKLQVGDVAVIRDKSTRIFIDNIQLASDRINGTMRLKKYIIVSGHAVNNAQLFSTTHKQLVWAFMP